MMMIVMGVSPLQYHRHVLFRDKKQTTIVNPKHTWWICPFVFGDEIEKLIFKNRSPFSVSIAYRAQLFPFEGFIILLCVVVIHPSHHSLLSSCLLSLPICYSPKEGAALIDSGTTRLYSSYTLRGIIHILLVVVIAAWKCLVQFSVAPAIVLILFLFKFAGFQSVLGFVSVSCI